MKFGNRARRFTEQIDVMRQLWSNHVVAYDGEFHKFEAAGINPEPVQKPIPVWIGAINEAAIRRAAKIADGWFMFPRQDPSDEAHAKLSMFRQTAAEAGREPDEIGVNATVFANQGAGADEWRGVMEQWRAMGANEFTFRTAEADLDGPDAHLAAIRAMAEAR